MSDRKTASTINDAELDALYERLDKAEQETTATATAAAHLTSLVLDRAERAEAVIADVREYAEICIAEHWNDASASWVLHLIEEAGQPARTTPNKPVASSATTPAGTEETEHQETP